MSTSKSSLDDGAVKVARTAVLINDRTITTKELSSCCPVEIEVLDCKEEEEKMDHDQSTVVDRDESDEQQHVRHLQEELHRVKVDAKETLTALLHFAQGVRTITRHMQSATMTDADEESKSEEERDINFYDNLTLVQMESMIAESCLHGTVFGTDLLRLWDTAHHVRDYARTVSEESSLSAKDVVQAQQKAKQAVERSERLEKLTRQLYRKNLRLRRRVAKLSSEKKVLVKEVKTLRQQVVTSRKIEMERLLQQHVVGALLLHEGQLKAMAASRKEKELRRQVEEEEEKQQEEEEDLELIQVEDCEAEEATEQPNCTPTNKEIPEERSETCDQDDEKASDSKSPCKSITKHDDGDNKTKEEEQSDDKTNEKANSDDKTNEKAESDDNTASSQSKQAGENSQAENDSPYPPNPVVERSEILTESADDHKPIEKPLADSVGFGGGLGFSKFNPWSTPPPKQQTEPPSIPTGTTTKSAEEPTKKTDTSPEKAKHAAVGEDNSGELPKQTTQSTLETEAKADKAPEEAKQTAANKENKLAASIQKDEASPSENKPPIADPSRKHSTVSLSAAYAPVKLFPGFGRASPVPPEKPNSSRSVSSVQSSYSQQSSGGANNTEHVGNKIFNFIFYPEKIHQQPRQQQPREANQQQHEQKIDQQNAGSIKKCNPLLKLDGPDVETDEKSVDNTIPTVSATTPGSSCAASRATPVSEEPPKYPCVDKTTEGDVTGSQRQQHSSGIIPNCVSFSEDTLSVQSNLNSPLFQASPKYTTPTRVVCDIDSVVDAAKSRSDDQDVELYKDLKVFRSLAIPTEEDIDEYHEYQDQRQLLASQQ